MNTAPAHAPARPTLAESYDNAFYDAQQDGSARSAALMLPLVFDLLAPRRVIDVGCGVGAWASLASRLGAEEAVGVDGPHLEPHRLRLDPQHFIPRDLETPLPLGDHPRLTPGAYDLAICLELAEHLPPARGPELVRELCALAPAVLFSAAIPYQGGTNHVNERWQDEWALDFLQQGRIPVDTLRSAVWNDPRVDWWYAQNTILYVDPALAAQRPHLRAAIDRTDRERLAVVHPRRYLWLCRQAGLRPDGGVPSPGALSAARASLRPAPAPAAPAAAPRPTADHSPAPAFGAF